MGDGIMDVRNAGNVCRLCLSTDEPVTSVFDDGNSAVSLTTKIRASLSIEILTDDKLSTLICGNCWKRVDDWHAYREACLRSQDKLQKCFRTPLETIPNIKTEPMDVEDPIEVLETVLTSDDEWEDLPDLPVNATIANAMCETARNGQLRDPAMLKQEPRDNNNDVYQTNPVNAVETTRNRELLFNPMAVTNNKEDRLMEPDSTEKFIRAQKMPSPTKKKVRRGPATHYRGTKKYKKRCVYCQIYLHSKNSYRKHMNRFHSGTQQYEAKSNSVKLYYDNVRENCDNHDVNYDDDDEDYDLNVDAEEMIEDVEDELISLEKDAPLTPVQQNIISQLKTFSCYSCQQIFQDRRSTLNHIRQHMPDLRPYTCIACLTEFADRSIYKLHCGASFQCAMKIALVVPEHGTEKYFTCNMCLRPLTNRKELLSHLSKHSDKQYEQLRSQPFRSPPKLKPMTNVTSTPHPRFNRDDKSRVKIIKNSKITENRKFYKNDDETTHNKCMYCGMIYRHKTNFTKHVNICKKLKFENRTCYRCVECGMTFTDVRRINSHLRVTHKIQNLECFDCHEIFTNMNDYASHTFSHRSTMPDLTPSSPQKIRHDKFPRSTLKNWQSPDNHHHNHQRNNKIVNYACALCPRSNFATRTQLAEHRNVHLKSNNYTCEICRRTFGRASSLEAHMLQHELEISSSEFNANTTMPMVDREMANASMTSDPGTSNTECQTCGKVFANYPNLRRHIRSVHDTIGRYSCFTCAKTFTSEEQWSVHVNNEHKNDDDTSINCPQCPEQFSTNDQVDKHRREIHGINGEEHLACYICGKKFVNESSLRIHRGHHFRVNSRLSIGNNHHVSPIEQKLIAKLESTSDRRTSTLMKNRANDGTIVVDQSPTPKMKSPRARKSFPNSSTSTKQLSTMLQCQVCDDRFANVAALRKHLWDVHCARGKPEKITTMEKLQCELCTNVLPDEESLASHMKWHEKNPILSDNNTRIVKSSNNPVGCDLCGKFYSSIGNLRKHKKRHKVGNLAVLKLPNYSGKNRFPTTGFTCNYCRKVFATRLTLTKHKELSHGQSQQQQRGQQQSIVDENPDDVTIKPMRPKLDFDTLLDDAEFPSTSGNGKKSVTCTLCRRSVPNMRALYRHRQIVHKITIGKPKTVKSQTEIFSSVRTKMEPKIVSDGQCPDCGKLFPSVSRMKQHYTKMHRRDADSLRCSIDDCRLSFKTVVAKQNHEKSHANVMYTCRLCQRQMLNLVAMTEHMLSAHKTNYDTSPNKLALCKKINLDNYVVRGANGRECPECNIVYPNFKAMKIHYLKMHDVAN